MLCPVQERSDLTQVGPRSGTKNLSVSWGFFVNKLGREAQPARRRRARPPLVGLSSEVKRRGGWDHLKRKAHILLGVWAYFLFDVLQINNTSR